MDEEDGTRTNMSEQNLNTGDTPQGSLDPMGGAQGGAQNRMAVPSVGAFPSAAAPQGTVPMEQTAFPAAGTDAATQVMSPVAGFADEEIDPGDALAASKRRRRVWPWIVLVVVLLLGAAAGGTVWFFQGGGPMPRHALPGTSLWGTSVAGKSADDIASDITTQVNESTVPVSYEGNETKIGLPDLGLDVDADAIANQAVEAKRGGAWWEQLMFWVHEDVSPELVNEKAADTSALNERLGIEETKPVDATVALNADGNGFDVTPGQQGQGADATEVVREAVDAVKSLGSAQPKTVTVSLEPIDPKVTDDVANQAKATLDGLAQKPLEIKIGDHTIASLDAKALASAMSIDANDKAPLKDGQGRNGYVVFDAAKLQQYYEANIKNTFKADRVDGDVVVNNNGDVIETKSEGHDGITIADGGDANLGADAAKALSDGSPSVEVQGSVNPMEEKKTKKHVIIDLSDQTLTMVENDKAIATYQVGIGQGNAADGSGRCVDDFCTPTGDFTIFRKVYNETMRGEVARSDGTIEKWEVPNIGFANYITSDGVAIHRITTQMNNSSIAAQRPRISHGCIGLGWDVAQSFYDWAPNGTSVHIQL